MKKTNVYDMITKRILEQLEQGVAPWHKPWTGTNGAYSRNTGKDYSFLNQMFMPAGEYATFNQIKKEGGKVKAGEHGYPLVFYKTSVLEIEDKETGEKFEKIVPVLRYYTVFNIGLQVEGLEIKHAREDAKNDLSPIEKMESIKNNYLTRSGVKFANIEGNRANYNPSHDQIVLPLMEQFDCIEEYYSTAFHEMAHSTGHKSRLGRITKPAAFGSNNYGKEELIAEITAAAVMNETGTETEKTFGNSAAYIDNWKRAIKGDNKLIVHAASKAQKAFNMIMGIFEDTEKEQTTKSDNAAAKTVTASKEETAKKQENMTKTSKEKTETVEDNENMTKKEVREMGAAVTRIVKNAKKAACSVEYGLDGIFTSEHKNGDEVYCVSDMCRAVRFFKKPQIEGIKETTSTLPLERIFETPSEYPPIELPSFEEIKTAKKGFTKANGKQPFKLGEYGIYVNPAYLYDMIKCLPGAKVYANANDPKAPIYFKAENGDGILFPVLPLKKTGSR